jgi:hypothetical protein
MRGEHTVSLPVVEVEVTKLQCGELILVDTNYAHFFQKVHSDQSILKFTGYIVVGRLVVVIDVNPSHGFWTTRLMKLFGHEGK